MYSKCVALERRTLKWLKKFFFLICFFSPSGTHQKEITRCYSQWPCGYECFQWTALSLNDYWVSTVILPWCQVYSKGVFPIVFALQKLYYNFFYTSPKYLHIDVNLFGLLFSNFTQWFQALTKWFIIFIFILYYFFLIQIRGEVHQWKLSTRFSALRDSRTKTHFMR